MCATPSLLGLPPLLAEQIYRFSLESRPSPDCHLRAGSGMSECRCKKMKGDDWHPTYLLTMVWESLELGSYGGYKKVVDRRDGLPIY